MGIGLVSGGVLWLLLALTNQLDVLAHTNTSALGIVLVSLVLGASYAWLFPYGGEHNQSVDEVAATARGLLLGLFIWLVVKLNLQPMLVGQPPLWQAEAVLAALPGLLLCLFLGGFFGLLYLPVFRGLAGPMRMIRQAGAPPPIQTRIVVLGGGYAGVSAAETLEREFAHDLSVAIWLVSETNFLLHTPMLSEVAASAVNAQHISPPLRNTFQHVQVVRAAVERADMGERVVYLAADERTPGRQLAFDHLVVALGAEPNFFGNAGIEANSFTFKSLDDAVRLRNHLIDLFERADQEADVAVRQAMLTFVVAGGGFAGVELMGSLNDFARGITPHYPNINPGEVRMVLVHSGETILPELSVELGKYAQQKMEERGVEFRLKTRVTGAEPGQVLLGAEAVASQTFVWTAGNRPCPVLQQLGVPLTQRGQVEVTRQLSAPTIPYLWAAGDCAQIPYPHSRTGFAPPTAQHALREGKLIGQNIAASIRKRPLKEFDFKTLGSLSALGHQLAVAELFGYRFSGLLAWMMWRAIYLAKLPTLEKRVRVGLDWLLDLFFPPDIVQTIDFGRENKNK
jgi:NADH dehydrogenase